MKGAADPPGLGRELEEVGCEALLVVAGSSRDVDLAPFAGPVHLGQALLVAPRGGPLHLAYFTPMERGEAAASGLALLDPEELGIPRLAREGRSSGGFLAAVLERALTAAGVVPSRVALAGHAATGRVCSACRLLEKEGWVFVDGNDLMRRVRKSKPDRQQGAIRAAAAGAGAALRHVAARLAASAHRDGGLELGGAPLTVGRLRGEVAEVLARHGLEQPEGNLLAPAEEGAVPHNTGTPGRVLRPGESLVVDLFPRGELFADVTRTFCVGPPPPPLAAAHRAVAETLAAARARSAPGVRGWTLQEAACRLLGDRGYETPVSHPESVRGYVHNLGHGVGFELHEYPSFGRDAGAEGVLAAGDVFTLEPGLYEPEGGWAVRLEDTLLLGTAGLEVLTELPYDLDPRAWEDA